MIFVSVGRSNAFCLASTNGAKSAEISRSAAGSGLIVHPMQKRKACHGKPFFFYRMMRFLGEAVRLILPFSVTYTISSMRTPNLFSK